ncbi:MAG: hypothetical protein ABGX16_22205 [Pirellulales bacterium]
MIHILKNLMCMLLALAVLIPMVAAQSTKNQPQDVPPHVWQPVQDEMFLQEVGRQVPTSDPLTAITIFGSAPRVVPYGWSTANFTTLLDDVGCPMNV